MGAGRLKIQGKWYRATVFKIVDKEAGVPKTLTLIREDEKVSIQGGEEFMTAFAPESMVQPH